MGVWEIVKLPEGEKAIPYSKIFRDKRGPDGNVKVQSENSCGRTQADRRN
jgi:hypothetical protein